MYSSQNPPHTLAARREAARGVWDSVLASGRTRGFRNAQATVLAPTGTISFMMDCDTTGVEPDLALVKHKRLVGGGTLRIVNDTVPSALKNLGYSDDEVTALAEDGVLVEERRKL